VPPHASAYRYSIEARIGYVMVAQIGLTRTLAEAEGFQAAVDEALAAHGSRRVLLDNRRTERPDELVRASMWTWVSGSPHFDRFALLVDGERTSQRANLTAGRNRAALAAFTREDEALEWLLA
jgi:hypothetical protein